jgi:hypothetical protein
MIPERKYDGDSKAGAADVHPSFRTRKQHIQMIGAISRKDGKDAAMRYWLSHCPRISKSVFLKVCGG